MPFKGRQFNEYSFHLVRIRNLRILYNHFPAANAGRGPNCVPSQAKSRGSCLERHHAGAAILARRGATFPPRSANVALGDVRTPDPLVPTQVLDDGKLLGLPRET